MKNRDLTNLLSRASAVITDPNSEDTEELKALIEDLNAESDRLFIESTTPAVTWDTTREKPRYADWQYEVANGDTLLGFADWLEHNPTEDSGNFIMTPTREEELFPNCPTGSCDEHCRGCSCPCHQAD